jgi:hypothetical protein
MLLSENELLTVLSRLEWIVLWADFTTFIHRFVCYNFFLYLMVIAVCMLADHLVISVSLLMHLLFCLIRFINENDPAASAVLYDS